MKIEIRHHNILIFPENEQDKFYIEEALGLKKAEDWTRVVRVDEYGISCAYIKVEKKQGEGGK